jgi:hypothetical protein
MARGGAFSYLLGIGWQICRWLAAPPRHGANLLDLANLHTLSMLSRRSVPHSSLALLHCPLHRVTPAALAEAFNCLGRFTTAHVMEHLGLPITRSNEMAIAKQARSLGYVKARLSINGVQHWVFLPPVTSDSAA